MDLNIDLKSHIPLYQQIVNEIIKMISSGRINKGEYLPSVRELSATLGINPATVVRAYRRLESIEIISTRKGVGSVIIALPKSEKDNQLFDLYKNFMIKAREMGFSEKDIIELTSKHSLNSILITDIGSTTTKSILFKRNSSGKMVFHCSSFAKTTVEAPDEDVWIGIKKSVESLENKANIKLLNNNDLIIPSIADSGVDLFLATSSAGGGLQMVTVGLVAQFTGESAERTALGAGAIIIDVLAVNDGKTPYEKISSLQELKPDIILLSGGVENGAISGVVELGEILAFSGLKGKFGNYKIPLIYAGNSNAQEFIRVALKDKFELSFSENIRPELSIENPEPTRKEIQNIFMNHVMKRAPGYNNILKKFSSPILPTPAAVFELLKKYSKQKGKNILAFDIGGATTDVFSTYNNITVRTVSANLGMSYSLLQSIDRIGLPNITKWISKDISSEEILNIAANKMINPTSLPSHKMEKEFETAVAKEILHLSFVDHKKLAQYRYDMDMFTEKLKGKNTKEKEFSAGKSVLDTLNIDMVIGSGGILSHQELMTTFEVMLDSLFVKGITEFYVDSEFMIPHLGVLTSVNPALGLELFERECLIHLGTVLSANGEDKAGNIAFTLKENNNIYKIRVGDFLKIPNNSEELSVEVKPTKKFDVGNGPGKPIIRNIKNGVFGIICDMREKPMTSEDILKKVWGNITQENRI
jgi:uncharacterized protein (TIGR01319 family)